MNEVIGKKMRWIRGLTLSKRGEGVRESFWGTASGFVLILLLSSANLFAAEEQRFDALQIGGKMYQNVTVTTKARSYIFIKHSAGLASIKVSELPNDLLQKLGYITAPKPQTNSAALWAKQAVGKMGTPQIKKIEAQLLQKWSGSRFLPKIQTKISTGLVITASLILLLAHALFSYCCYLICRKSGNEPGALVWLPLLQALPIYRAASMSAWWSVTLLVPGLNLLGYALWCAKIVEVRHKNVLLLIFLLLPVTNLCAFFYLAFSAAASPKAEPVEPHLQIMTLESA